MGEYFLHNAFVVFMKKFNTNTYQIFKKNKKNDKSVVIQLFFPSR